MAFTLINARPSPYGRKVAVVLQEKGIDYSVTYDVPWGDDTCTPSYSPLQQLPILITDADEYIYDSVYIVDWLEARFPTPALLPADLDARLLAQKRRMLGERLLEVAQALMFELLRPEPSTAWTDRQARKVQGALAELERLQENHVPQTAQGLDLGDIAVASTLLGLEYVMSAGIAPNVDALQWRGKCVSLTAAITRLEARPSFVATVPQMMDVNLRATLQ